MLITARIRLIYAQVIVQRNLRLEKNGCLHCNQVRSSRFSWIDPAHLTYQSIVRAFERGVRGANVWTHFRLVSTDAHVSLCSPSFSSFFVVGSTALPFSLFV